MLRGDLAVRGEALAMPTQPCTKFRARPITLDVCTLLRCRGGTIYVEDESQDRARWLSQVHGWAAGRTAHGSSEQGQIKPYILVKGSVQPQNTTVEPKYREKRLLVTPGGLKQVAGDS